MEITNSFKQCVQKIRNDMGLSTPSEELFRKSKTKREGTFHASALELMNDVMTLDGFIKENLAAYINMKSYVIGSNNTGMTDKERDAIDEESTLYLKKCNEKISTLRALATREKGHRRQHVDEVVNYIVDRLNVIAKSVKKQQEQRFKHVEAAKHKLLPKGMTLSDKKRNQTRQSLDEPKLVLAPEQEEELRLENVLLEARLHDELDAAHEMETKIVQISTLFDQFTTKITEQHDQIGVIHETAQKSTLDIQSGNQHLRKAIDYGSSYGFFLFCFFVGLSMLLLLLHYFN